MFFICWSQAAHEDQDLRDDGIEVLRDQRSRRRAKGGNPPAQRRQRAAPPPPARSARLPGQLRPSRPRSRGEPGDLRCIAERLPCPLAAPSSPHCIHAREGFSLREQGKNRRIRPLPFIVSSTSKPMLWNFDLKLSRPRRAARFIASESQKTASDRCFPCRGRWKLMLLRADRQRVRRGSKRVIEYLHRPRQILSGPS